MDLYTIPPAAIRDAAARKAGVPLWRIGAVVVPSGLYAHARILAGGTVTVTERDILLEDAIIRTRHPAPGGTLS